MATMSSKHEPAICSAGILFRQMPPDHTMDVNIKNVHCKPRVHASVGLFAKVWPPRCPMLSFFVVVGRTHSQCMLRISGSVPIVMILHLTALWAAGAQFSNSFFECLVGYFQRPLRTLDRPVLDLTPYSSNMDKTKNERTEEYE